MTAAKRHGAREGASSPRPALLVDGGPGAGAIANDIRGANYRVVVAHDAVSALAAVESLQPVAAAVALRREPNGGLEALAALHRAHPALPCIALAPRVDAAAAIAAMRAGARDMLPLPPEPGRLIEAFERVIGRPGGGDPSVPAAERERREHLLHAGKTFALGALVAGVSHEINNPNQVLMSSAAALEDIWSRLAARLDAAPSWTGDGFTEADWRQAKDDTAQIFRFMKKETERIKRVVFDLRDFARGQSEDDDGPVDINAVAGQALGLAANPVSRATWDFRRDFADGLPHVHGNAVRIRQALVHVLLNACEALPEPGCAAGVATRYDAGDGCVAVEVWNEGPGVSPQVRSKLFAPFVTTKHGRGHLGLGLYLVRLIAEEHGGEARLLDRPEGGVSAVLRLPVRPSGE